MKRAFITLLALMFMGTPAAAFADCYAGSAQLWSDVDSVEIDRCQPTSVTYPCIHVIFAPLGHGMSAVMVARQFNGRKGLYKAETRSDAEWAAIISEVRLADFYDLEIPNPRLAKTTLAEIHTDAPFNQVVVHRCHTARALDANVIFDERSEQYQRFIRLADGITAIAETLRWKRQNGEIRMGDIQRYFIH